MEAIMHNTDLFKNIFNDYDVFATWYKGSGLSDGDTDVPSRKTFALIYNEYADSHCCMSAESFKNHFANTLYTYYKEFEETTKALTKLMNLSDDDAKIDRSMIVNFANIPETAYDTDTDVVNFVSQHTKNISIKGNTQILREQIANKRSFTTKTFLKRFQHLFVKVLRPAYTFVVSEPDEE